MNKIGTIISIARKKAGLTQEAFAAKLGITPQAVSKWENDVGYPDVALLPEISKILDISLDKLFSTENSETEKTFYFPDHKYGLPFVCSFGDTACYSDKSLEKYIAEDGTATFTDGSTVYIPEGLAINQGKGEIRLAKGETNARKQFKTVLDKTIKEFDSIDMTLALGAELEIVAAKDGFGAIYVEGTEAFIALVQPAVLGKTLTLSVSKQGRNETVGRNALNRIAVYVPFRKGRRLALKISGMCKAKIEPLFEEISVSVSGSGEFEAIECDILEISVSGSADVSIDRINDCANCCINGSGDLNIGTANNVKAAVSGSGEISIGTATGMMDVTVNGSGDIAAGGDIDILKLAVNGSGDFNGKGLSVNEAELTVGGSADIYISHIKGRSVERLSENSTLVVSRRG